jgi:hypothetical protein
LNVTSGTRHPNLSLKPGCGTSFAEHNFTGCVFGDMFFKFITPKGLKRPAASIQSVHLCKIRMFTAQIAPFDGMGGNTGVF